MIALKDKKILFIQEALLFLLFLVFFHLWTHVSLLFQINSGWSKIYFTTVMGIALVHWFGPRVILPLYLNSILSAGLWGRPDLLFYPIHALPESITVFLSWWTFSKKYKGECWLPDIKNLISFILFGVGVPVLALIILHEIIFFSLPDINHELNAVKALNIFLAEFLTIISVSIPVLYFFSFYVSRLKLSVIYKKPGLNIRFTSLKNKGDLLWVVILIILLVALNFFVDFIEYWFVYGLIAILISAKRGFSFSIMSNLAIFINAYVIYYLFFSGASPSLEDLKGENSIYLALCLLFVATYIIGRVISDNKHAHITMKAQNDKLKKVNEELDRFVYSVSHDLSSPLKSIKGLVNLAVTDSDKDMLQKYLFLINKSVIKLDEFIKEVLDFSRSTRAELTIEKLNLEEHLKNSLSAFEYQDEYAHIQVSIDLKVKELYSDKLRLKIVLNNIISNAIKYRNKELTGSFLKITSQAKGDRIFISFEDNGLGMEQKVQKKIFDLFYRGHDQATGAGLGLYIVKEALNKLKGKIIVKSQPEMGSTFIVEFPNQMVP